DSLVLAECRAGDGYGRVALNVEAAPHASAARSALVPGPTDGAVVGQRAVEDGCCRTEVELHPAARGGTSGPTSGARGPDDLIAHKTAVADVQSRIPHQEAAAGAGAERKGATGGRAADGLVVLERRTANGRVSTRVDSAAHRPANKSRAILATGCAEGLI